MVLKFKFTKQNIGELNTPLFITKNQSENYASY